MGIDRHSARLLCWLRGRGVSFQRTLLLGRQGLHLSRADLRHVLAEARLDSSAEHVERLFAEQRGFAEPFVRQLGAEEIISLDASAFEGATWQHDLNLPIPDGWKQRFGVVFDGGTLEHVFDFPTALKNVMDLLEVGGHYVALTPANNFLGHGFYQFSPDLFFRVFGPASGFRLNVVLLIEMSGRTWYQVKDPAAVGGRIHLNNRGPTSLAVWATKSQHIADRIPRLQQSDYEARWSCHEGAPPAAPPVCGHARAHNRPWYRSWLRAAQKWLKPRYPRKYFTPFKI